MHTLLTIIGLLIVLGVVVFVHEFGHFMAARWAGVRVDAFSIGFGPAIFKWTDKRGTIWKLCWLPLGGYVSIYGQEDMFHRKKYADLPPAKKVGHYLSVPAWKQFIIIAAGVCIYKDKSNAAIYARAIANMRAGNLDVAKTGTQTLLKRHPKSPYFYELLGDIEYQYGHYDDSVDAYEQSLNLSNNAPQIETALAVVLAERNKSGDKERAGELCRRVILKEPSPLAYWILARVSDGATSDWAMAEFYKMNNDEKNAKKYAKMARTKAKKDSPEYIKSGDILKLKK